MTTTLPGFPAELLAVVEDGGAVRVEIDDTLYPLEALYGAAYVFIDRAYVLLDRPGPGRFRVTLAPKAGAADLRALVGEFLNELLSCAWRHQITRDNRAVIEEMTMQAMSGALGPPSLDDLAAFDFTAEPFDDPLGIAMSWEEKYKKKAPAEPAPTAAPVEETAAPSGAGEPDEGPPR